jgi:hypothetical protein
MNPTTPGSCSGRNASVFLTTVLLLALSAIVTVTAEAQVPLTKLSTDTFTNQSSQHATEVEPDSYAFGSTIVAAFQMGRFVNGGGSSDIGFATSTDGGVTWTNGFLPGITVFVGGSFERVSDPSVAFDAAHGVWLITTIAINSEIGVAVLASSSNDGINWNNPVVVNNNSGFADKDWIACDNNASSPFFGHCYVEWDDAFGGGQVRMSTSTDGGQTWGAGLNVPNAFGLGGQPVVQPNGTVVVPFESSGIQAFVSTNGGASWKQPVTVSNIIDHGVAGGLRTSPLPSAEIDAAGTVYVVWQDCRFRSGCSSNDIVMSTSTNGTSWSAVTRIPIDATSSTVDHFIPGIAVDPTTSGGTAHLALTYYFYPVANCSQSTCKMGVGFIISRDGGQTWSLARKLAGPMKLVWLANTDQGRMVGDYMSTSYVNGKAFGIFAKANMNNGQVFDQAMYTTVKGHSAPEEGPFFSSAAEQPVPNAKSDHGPRKFYDLEGKVPIPPEKQR